MSIGGFDAQPDNFDLQFIIVTYRNLKYLLYMELHSQNFE